MKEMMEAKLMALKKLKKKMHALMKHEKAEEKHEMMPKAAKMSSESYEIDDDDPNDIQNKRNGVRQEHDMIPRKSGKTKNVMMRVGVPRKFGKMK
jgi:hypothetical protein